jgi:hypothetical protein
MWADRNYSGAFDLLLSLEQHIGGNWFRNSEEVETAFREWLRMQNHSFQRVGNFNSNQDTESVSTFSWTMLEYSDN